MLMALSGTKPQNKSRSRKTQEISACCSHASLDSTLLFSTCAPFYRLRVWWNTNRSSFKLKRPVFPIKTYLLRVCIKANVILQKVQVT